MKLYIYLGEEFIGTANCDFVRGSEKWMFEFAADYLSPTRPILDPAIMNVRGPQFAEKGAMFGFLADVAPDRWGRKLIRRRAGHDLKDSDYLLGVCDFTRQGALRIKLSKAGTTFFSKRFDRDGTRRIHYASAMTMLGAKDGEEGHSYLEIAEWLAAHSAAAEADLHELWSRMVFSQLIGNTDDHLRNHGFLLTKQGWRLAPMFDVNPNPRGGESALDKGDPIKDAAYYRLTQSAAEARYCEISSRLNLKL